MTAHEPGFASVGPSGFHREIVAFTVVLALIVRCPATDAGDGAIAALRDASALPKFALECLA
jgi:hypothetical protein